MDNRVSFSVCKGNHPKIWAAVTLAGFCKPLAAPFGGNNLNAEGSLALDAEGEITLQIGLL